MEYQEALVKLHQLTRMGISPGLERIEELTRRLGFPQSQLPCCIHISGTNGKGSVAAMLDAILRQEGRKTALVASCLLYTSCYCALCWAGSFWWVARIAASHLRKKVIRQIHRSMKSILMYGIEKLKCRCPRTNKMCIRDRL